MHPVDGGEVLVALDLGDFLGDLRLGGGGDCRGVVGRVGAGAGFEAGEGGEAAGEAGAGEGGAAAAGRRCVGAGGHYIGVVVVEMGSGMVLVVAAG